MSKNNSLIVVLLALTIIFAAFIAYYNLILGVIALIIALIIGFLSFRHSNQTRNDVLAGIDRIYKQFDSLNRNRMNQLPVAYTIVDSQGKIVWYNDAFYQNFYRKNNRKAADITGRNIENELNLTLEECLNAEDLNYSFRKIDYEIVTQQISDSRGDLYIINFFDVTLLKRQKEIYSRYEPVFCYMSVDNFDETVDSLPSYEKSAVQSQIDLKITDWANRKDAFVLHYENDRYLVIFEREKLQIMLDARFHILDEIREIKIDEKNLNLSLSVGVGVSDKPLTIKEADALSHSALEIAQARGGDQAVVKIDDDISYYGGKNEAKEKHNKVKARIKAQGLKELIKDADNVLIMGHKTPDMDSLGAGIGLIDASRELGKNAKFILNDINYGIKGLCDYLSKEERYTDIFVTPEEAEQFVRDNTLLIVVDTQNREYVDYPPILEQVDKKVVIDHHRRPDKTIEKPLLEYTEVYASSACELVTELLSYFDIKQILSPVGANVLMSGICMDTKMFANKTGVRTFEAASFLKRRGADMQQAKALLQDDFETYTNRMKAIQGAQIYFDRIALSVYEDQSEYAKIIAAQAADEMLNIKGIKASFVIVKGPEEISISGRSNGEINVQLILEALGGGGHFAMAGTQLHDVTDLSEAKEMLLEQIGLYVEERKQEFENNIT